MVTAAHASSFRPAAPDDVTAIRAILVANAAETSLFQQSERRIRKTLGDFILAVDGDRVLGCAAVQWHRPTNAEILAVAVAPEAHGRGIGGALMRECIARAQATRCLWLATQKPDYFARFGFAPMSKWRLPFGVLVAKLLRLVEQPPRRWLPALFGRHTFMRFVRS